AGDRCNPRLCRLITTEPAGASAVPHGPGVLQQRAQSRRREAHAIAKLVVFDLGNDTKALSITFISQQVGTLTLGESIEQSAAVCFGALEPVPNRVLSGMTERWITDIVTETGGLYDHAQISRRDPVWQPLAQEFTDKHAQAASHAAHLQGVGETGVDMIVISQRVHLGLAPEPTK